MGELAGSTRPANRPDAERGDDDVNRINELRQLQERLASFDREARELATQVNDYRARYQTVAGALGETPAGSIQEIGAAARGLIERYETARKEMSRRETLSEQLQPAGQDHQQRCAHLDKLRRQRTDLLEHGGTTDAEEFRTRARHFAERRQAEDSRKEIVARLQRPVAPAMPGNSSGPTSTGQRQKNYVSRLPVLRMKSGNSTPGSNSSAKSMAA